MQEREDDDGDDQKDRDRRQAAPQDETSHAWLANPRPLRTASLLQAPRNEVGPCAYAGDLLANDFRPHELPDIQVRHDLVIASLDRLDRRALRFGRGRRRIGEAFRLEILVTGPA